MKLPLITFFLLLIPFGSLKSQTIETILEASQRDEVSWSVSVRDTDGALLESYQPNKLIIPASNQKLFSTAAVLDGLGSDFAYNTIIFGDGKKVGNTWEGDLIIQGSGDPSISGFLYDEDRYYVFRQLVQQLKNQGIQRLNGTLIGDVSYFDNQKFPKGWDWDDLSFYYGVEIGPLSFNNNAVDLIVNADGEIGGTPRISWFPENTSYVSFLNNQVIAHPNTKYDEYYRRELGKNTIELGSSLPQGYEETEALSIDDAAMFFLHSFDAYLNNEGITTAHLLDVTEESALYSQLDTLAIHTSKPLSKLVEWANKESDNFYTEMLVKTLAAEKMGTPATFEDGTLQVRSFIAQQGVDTNYVEMKDASGMASGNFTQTSALSQFLVSMRTHPEFSAYYNSLSIAGVDGTIAHRMKGTPLYKVW
jgi:D-alanyl-D-alanine carboxypeptidase/D-alanyl-D-alanine-endopeptidase (penicillin-binding protein 4)